jgi:hypothetical protein
VRVLDAARELFVFTTHGRGNPITAVGFSPDAKRLLAQHAANPPATTGFTSCWDALTGQFINPCTDAPLPTGPREAASPDGKLHIKAEDHTVRVYRSAADEPTPEQLAEQKQNRRRLGLLWHRREAAECEKAADWFAAAFHLRQLIALDEPDAEKLRERLKLCEDRLRQP